MPTPRSVILYTRAGCRLCDLALEDLQLLGYEVDLTVRVVDIGTEPALLERFHVLIPVVDVEGGPLLTPPITLQRLRAALAEARPTAGVSPDRSSMHVGR